MYTRQASPEGATAISGLVWLVLTRNSGKVFSCMGCTTPWLSHWLVSWLKAYRFEPVAIRLSFNVVSVVCSALGRVVALLKPLRLVRRPALSNTELLKAK